MELIGWNSTGLTYRANYVWRFRLISSSSSSIVEIERYTEEAYLTIDSSDLLSTTTEIIVTVSVTTYLGTTDTINFNIDRELHAAPEVSITGVGNNWVAGRDLLLLAEIDASETICENVDLDTISSNFEINWIFDHLDNEIIESNAIIQSNQLVIPAGTLTV